MTANGAFGRNAGHGEARRHLGDAVAMAHPDLMLLTQGPGGVEQVALGFDLDIGAAEFAVMPALDFAAELGGHGHLAVADAEHRHAGIEDRLRRARRAGLVHRLRSAGEDHGFRLHFLEGCFRLLERHDFGIDALLAHPARDQLRHLTAEIDDQKSCHAPRPVLASTWALAVLLSWTGITRREAPSQPRQTGGPHSSAGDGQIKLGQYY